MKEFQKVKCIKPIKKRAYGKMMTVVRPGTIGLITVENGKMYAVFVDKGEVYADVEEFKDCIEEIN